MRAKDTNKRFVCKHITIRPDQNERTKNWPHGLLSKITQDALDAFSDNDVINYCKNNNYTKPKQEYIEHFQKLQGIKKAGKTIK
jgi:hypothetical protein